MFNSYDELRQAVEERRSETLTLEVDMGSEYSQEYEDAKKELQSAQAMKMLTGDRVFLSDNMAELEAKVAAAKPPSNSVWIQFKKLPLVRWAALLKETGVQPVDQYEKVLSETFVGVYGQDPSNEEVIPLSTDPATVSSKSEKSILPGGSLFQIIQAFMGWQNSGGDVSIRPTKSGQD